MTIWPDCPAGRRAVVGLVRRRLAPGQVEVLCTWRSRGLTCHQWVPIGQLKRLPGQRLGELPLLRGDQGHTTVTVAS
ncbi:MAG: hypothetical protein L0Y54_10000 [Sporichthyaceae bacterium]|nr:hypothetical protein [Sporichthyaceae bacterium]